MHARAARERFTLALLFVDLDGFKQVNDTLGHGLGDEVLVQVGEAAARAACRGTEVLARLGGDEFTVLVERVSGSRDAIDIADRIHATLTRPFDGPEGPSLHLGASVGIALERERPAHVPPSCCGTPTTPCTRPSDRAGPAGSSPTRAAPRAAVAAR